MATTSRLPKMDGRQLQDDILSERSWNSRGKRTNLPGIGSYVIDSPEDKNMTARQQCLRYQESHRGIVRSKIESLPDIPKRCHLKSVPVVTLKETYDIASRCVKDATPRFGGAASQTQTHFSEDHTDCWKKNRKDSRVYQHYLSRESAAKIPLPQEELVSRSPIGRLSQCSPGMQQQTPVPVNGFGVRKQRPPGGKDFRHLRKEYTNLSVNVELAAPGQVTCKATDRELMSQADYRRQLTVLLAPLGGSGHSSVDRGEGRIHNGEGQGDTDVGDCDGDNCVLRHIPRDKIGPSTRHQIWASDLRLGQLLIQQNSTTPDLRRKLATSKVKSMSTTSLNHPTRNSTGTSFNNTNCPNRRSFSHVSGSVKPFIYGSPVSRFNQMRGTVYKNDKHANDNINNENNDDGDESEGDDEEWLNMVDTPLVDGAYDRFANVRLPRSRMPSRSTART